MDRFGGNQEGIWDSGTCAWMRATAKIATYIERVSQRVARRLFLRHF